MEALERRWALCVKETGADKPIYFVAKVSAEISKGYRRGEMNRFTVSGLLKVSAGARGALVSTDRMDLTRLLDQCYAAGFAELHFFIKEIIAT